MEKKYIYPPFGTGSQGCSSPNLQPLNAQHKILLGKRWLLCKESPEDRFKVLPLPPNPDNRCDFPGVTWGSSPPFALWLLPNPCGQTRIPAELPEHGDARRLVPEWLLNAPSADWGQ